MTKLRRYFGIPWLVLVLLASIHSIVMLVMNPQSIAWLGALLSTLPVLLFFGVMALSGKGRSPTRMTAPLYSAVIACILIISMDNQVLPLIYSIVLGIIGILLYDYWYSVIPAASHHGLKAGDALPDFVVTTPDGKRVHSRDWHGSPLLLLFIRGNWCPLCVSQVKELANEYQQIAAQGVQLHVISAQPVKETQKLAQKFSVPFRFFADPQADAAKTLGIQHADGSPLGMPGHAADTVIPSVIICNSKGIITHVDVSTNYRERPEPEKLLQQLALL